MKLRLALCVAATLVSGAAFAGTVSPTEKAAMQSAMFQHIDRQLVEGNYLDVDLKSGDVRALVPAKNHPMVLTLGDNYVLCTDFKTKNGESVNVDFYTSRKGKSFVIFRTEINNRAPLEAMMKAGKVTMAQ